MAEVGAKSESPLHALGLTQPTTKVKTAKVQAPENPIQLSLFNQVAVRVASRREVKLVDYLTDTEEAYLLSSQHFPPEVSTRSESFSVGSIRVIRSIPEWKSSLQSVRVMDGNPALQSRAALGGCQI